jgi:hypothetical protein
LLEHLEVVEQVAEEQHLVVLAEQIIMESQAVLA